MGKLIIFARSTRPIARIMTRSIYRVIAKASIWTYRVRLDNAAKKEIIWWMMNIDNVSGFTQRWLFSIIASATIFNFFQFFQLFSADNPKFYLFSADNL